MKRYLIGIGLCLVLALGILIAGNTAINRTEEQVEQTVTISRGDRAALTGLHLTSRITCRQKLLWETTRNMGSGESQTEFSFHSMDVPLRLSSSRELPPYQVFFRLCNSLDENDALCRRLAQQNASDTTRTVRLQDYFSTYPLYLGECFMDTDQPYYLNVATREDWCSEEMPFTLLQIPVEPEDMAEVYFEQSSADIESRYVDVYFSHIAHPYESFMAACPGGILLTVGFSPDAAPQAAWAPLGFGIWRIPQDVVEKTTRAGGGYVEQVLHCDRARLVYPLDIETQSVLAFQWSADEKSLFLVTAEGGEAVLRILDGETFEVQTTVSLGAIAVREEKSIYYGEGMREYPLTQSYYDRVSIHAQPDFTAIAVGDRLTVLVMADGAYRVDFSCPMVGLCRDYRESPNVPFWSDERPLAQTDGSTITDSPVTGSPYGDFSHIAMVYRDHKLAMAWYGGDEATHLHVYGPEGVIYAERSEPSILTQQTSNRHYFYLSDDLPQLTWLG